MKRLWIILVCAILLSGCVSKQETIGSRGTRETDPSVPELTYREGTDLYQESTAQEFPISTVCVPDKESALRIAGIIMENFQKEGLYPDYVPLGVHYDTDDEIWVVLYGELLPGAGISIAIRKSDAQIVAIWSGE